MNFKSNVQLYKQCNINDILLKFIPIYDCMNILSLNFITVSYFTIIIVRNQSELTVAIFSLYKYNVNDKVCVFENYVTELLNKHAPYRTFRITKKNSTPWISDEIKGMMNGRDSRKIKFNQTGNPTYFDDYKKIRNKVTKMRRKAFGSYIIS